MRIASWKLALPTEARAISYVRLDLIHCHVGRLHKPERPLLAECEVPRRLRNAGRWLLEHARASSVLLQFRQMSFRPSAKRVQRIDQRASEASERVFDSRRDDRVNFAQDQAVALQAAECLREHLLRNPTDFPL